MGHALAAARAWGALVAVVAAGCQAAPGAAGAGGQAATGLTKQQQQAARVAVEKDARFKEILGARERGFLFEKTRGDVDPRDRVYFTSAQPAAANDTGERPRGVGAGTVVVSHYRYRTDETILSVVDLATGKVLEVEKHAHLPTPLAPEEFDEAKALAFKNDDVKKALHGYADKLRVSFLMPRPARGDPAFGHRRVQLLFEVGGHFLMSPRVTVDLTEGKVAVEKVMPPVPEKDH
jgi:hypothetical protein